jgi:hypothetical protein
MCRKICAVPTGLKCISNVYPALKGWAKLFRAYGALVVLRGQRATAKTEKEKLEQALAIFTELKMPRERDAVQAELEKRVDSG